MPKTKLDPVCAVLSKYELSPTIVYNKIGPCSPRVRLLVTPPPVISLYLWCTLGRPIIRLPVPSLRYMTLTLAIHPLVRRGELGFIRSYVCLLTWI